MAKIKVGVNGYGTIGKRVATAVSKQDDMEVIGITKTRPTFEAKTAAAMKVLESHDFAAVHLEGPDEATHNHDLEHKIYSVECLSERVAKPLCAELRRRGEDFRLLILSDHRTFMKNGAHGETPVPYMIYDSRENGPTSGLGYTEKNGEAGPFLESGTELMPRLFRP